MFCEHCGRQIPGAVRSHARFCPGGRCRQAAYRRRKFTAELEHRDAPDPRSLIADVWGESPAVTLRMCLAVLRARNVPFERAWPVCLAHVGRDLEMLESLRQAFRAGYERQSTAVAPLHELRDLPDYQCDLPSHLRRVA